MPGIHFAYRAFSWPEAISVVAFLVLWILAEAIRRGQGSQLQASDSLDFAVNDLVKSVLSLLIWFVSCRFQGVHPLGSSTSISATDCHCSEAPLGTCDVPFHGRRQRFPISRSYINCPEPPPSQSIITLSLGSVRSTLPIFLLGFVYTLHAHTDYRAREFVDPITLYLAFPLTVLGIFTISQILSWRRSPSSFWYAAVLQFAGFCIARDALVGPAVLPYSLLLAFALCDSIWVFLVDVTYGLYWSSPVHLINTLIFAQSCLVHSFLFLLYRSHSKSYSSHSRSTTALQVLPLIEAAKGIAGMLIIQQHGGACQGILATLAATFLIIIDTWNMVKIPYSRFLGCLIAILGSGKFIFGQQPTDEKRHEPSISLRRCFAAAMVSLVALGHIAVVISQSSGTHFSDLSSTWRKLSGLSEDRFNCRAVESSTIVHAQTILDYAYFNNVLLIVFFSHARYDANLDFHREVYADYFPNIVYVGPATREDKGFAHSYDVLVDSFQSKEDLSDLLFYRMAGRMAHHMLYTALRENACYDGYLWVPFDTLLNVPRLQQFNQSLFWYHSPWGRPVPNLALGNFTESGLNVGLHAPPAMISPDPSINLTGTWRGWGPDWWWGDPHVGVSVCMNAFNKVPAEMRDNLARLNHGQTRLIGGSADTLYIPGRHRRAFMDVLALFLDTNCFLEIATPTTAHLVVPPGEPIQFVDHWWIYQPPFNASFVRQKWADGYEVDTFHTFHWGERGEDGIWRGDHRHVANVRHLLWESAHRQGLGDTFPVNLQGEHYDTSND